MLEEVGTVVEIEGELAWVETERRSACAGCDARGSCGTGTLASLFGRRRVRLRCVNAVGARPGEQVRMSVDEAAVSRGSLIVYALPLLGLLLGAGAGETLALQLGINYPDALALLLGTAGMAAGIAAGRRVSGGTERDQRFEPVLTSRVGGWPLDDSRDR